MAIRGRYAPSPTGRLHLGNARTAVLAWLQVRARGGAFVLRVEDLDASRSRPALEQALMDDLRWLGLDWDEGPDVGGPYGPYRQSERSERYEAAMARLDTYTCSCTRKELRDVVAAPHASEPRYPGTCRDAPRKPERPLAVRWRTPVGTVEFDDVLMGAVGQDVADTVGDFVLRRSDGAFAYQLAVVVDDADMHITDVLRGADLLTSTPRQVLLQCALGWPTPRYTHVPLVLGSQGERLAKRDGAPDLGMLRERGVEPGRVVAVLARSVDLVDEHVQHVRPHELISAFEVKRVRALSGRLRWQALLP